MIGASLWRRRVSEVEEAIQRRILSYDETQRPDFDVRGPESLDGC